MKVGWGIVYDMQGLGKGSTWSTSGHNLLRMLTLVHVFEAVWVLRLMHTY